MSKLAEVTIQKARPLPVIILADVSGSMAENGKIEALNEALREMIRYLGQQSSLNAEIHICIVTFGEEVKIHTQLQPAHQYENIPIMTANGGTPFGDALKLVNLIIEDKERIPSRSYRPTIVVVSDGMPTDAWEQPLEELLNSERASKATRLAMSIGPDADDEVLEKFINNNSIPLIHGKDARDIVKFFECVSISVSQRSTQVNPQNPDENSTGKLLKELEELDF